ncbi:hypothetical protein EsH8_I_000985 [Colletotrichum jinshuiense]
MANNVTQEVQLVVDDEIDTDTEADLESLLTDSTSLRSSVLEYRLENGRSYHSYKDGKYLAPNDEQENERLDMQHDICYLTYNDRLGIAPPCDSDAKVGRVLDLGTGTGLWAIDFADQHPEAEVLGVDLSPTQRKDIPPNVKFEVDDVEEEWLYSRPFDYIHSRFLNGSIVNWKKFITRAYNHLAPGGYFEIQDGDFIVKTDDDTLPPGAPLAQFCSLIREACVIFGQPFVDVPSLKDVLTEVGFEDVTVKIDKWPSNPWPKDPRHKKIGQWNYYNFTDAVEAVGLAPLTRAHNWTREEASVFCDGVRKDMRNTSIHSYMSIFTVVARKPSKEDAPASTTSP